MLSTRASMARVLRLSRLPPRVRSYARTSVPSDAPPAPSYTARSAPGLPRERTRRNGLGKTRAVCSNGCAKTGKGAGGGAWQESHGDLTEQSLAGLCAPRRQNRRHGKGNLDWLRRIGKSACDFVLLLASPPGVCMQSLHARATVI